MPSHLVTFCNNGQALFALVGPDGVERVVTIEPEALGQPVGGTVGAVFHDRLCYVAVQADPAVVVAFDVGFSPVRVLRLPAVSDIHGLAVAGSELVVVSTAHDRIVAVDLGSEAARTLWKGGEGEADTLHVNDVCVTPDGRVLASRFGPRSGTGPRNGAVFDAATGQVIADGLREPHSVGVDPDGIAHVLESATGDLLRCVADGSPRRSLGLLGYARGLAMDRETVAIGKSGYREDSRSGLGESRMAPLVPTEAARDASAASGIFLVERGTGASRFVDLTAVGREVYAVVACPP